MSKYTKADTIEEDGINIFRSLLDTKSFYVQDYSSIAKDRLPDIDGRIRLRDRKGKYTHSLLDYQIKSHKKMSNFANYSPKRSVLDYIAKSSVQTILIVVDVKSKRAFWSYLDERAKKKVLANKKGIRLPLYEIFASHMQSLHQEWDKIAFKVDSSKAKVAIDELTKSYKNNVYLVLGFISMFQIVSKNRLEKLIETNTRLRNNEVASIIDSLEEKSIVSKSSNYYFLNNSQIGLESLSNLLEDEIIDLNVIGKDITRKEKEYFYKQIAKLPNEHVVSYVKNIIVKINNLIKLKKHDLLYEELKSLELIASKLPAHILLILKKLPPIIKGISNNVLKRDLTIRCTQILESVYYTNLKSTFKILSSLNKETHPEVKEISLQSAQRIIKYDLNAINFIGYSIQLQAINEISNWDIRKQKRHYNLLIVCLKELLSPTFDSIALTNYATITYHSGSLPGNKDIEKIREKSLSILKELYVNCNNVGDKRTILSTMQCSTHFPYRHSYSNELKDLVTKNTNELLDFYFKIVSGSSNKILSIIEQDTCRISEHSNEYETRINELQSKITSNPDYQIYQLIIGSNRYSYRNMNWKEAEEKRLKKIEEATKGLSKGEFRKQILSISKDINNIENKYFNYFMISFAKFNPSNALSILKESSKSYSFSFSNLLIGGIEGSTPKEFRKLAIKWINKGLNIKQCAFLVSSLTGPDIELIQKLSSKAIEKKDADTISHCFFAIVKNYKTIENPKKLLLKLIQYLSASEYWGWVNHLSFYENNVFPTFNESDFDTLANCLENTPYIDYNVESLFKPIADKNPKKIISLLKSRVMRKHPPFEIGFDALPFNFYYLNKSLRKHGKITVVEVFKWFKDVDVWFTTSHFLANIFEEIDTPLEGKLLSLIKSKNKKNNQIAFSVLRAYDGKEVINNICKKIIKANPRNYELWEEIMDTMSGMGGVHGEYGFVHSLINKKENLQNWKKDKNNSIEEYCQKYEQYLDKKIHAYKSRADEDIMIRKKEFDY